MQKSRDMQKIMILLASCLWALNLYPSTITIINHTDGKVAALFDYLNCRSFHQTIVPRGRSAPIDTESCCVAKVTVVALEGSAQGGTTQVPGSRRHRPLECRNTIITVTVEGNTLYAQ
jgi:hypothetical protein